MATSTGMELRRRKRLLGHSLDLWRERGDEHQVAVTLGLLCDANRLNGLPKEGIQYAKDAYILERLGKPVDQAKCLISLAWALHGDKQFDAAEEAASRAIDLLPEQGHQSRVCQGHRVLGNVYCSKGETEKAIHHLETALGIASSSNWPYDLFWNHYSLALLFSGQGRFDKAQAHVQHTKSHTLSNPYFLAGVSWLQAGLWYEQRRLEEARSEALQALDAFEKLGATNDAEGIRTLLGRKIDAEGTWLYNGELPGTVQNVAITNSSCSDTVPSSFRRILS